MMDMKKIWKEKKKDKIFFFLLTNQSYFSRIKNEILKANLKIPLIFIYFFSNFFFWKKLKKI